MFTIEVWKKSIKTKLESGRNKVVRYILGYSSYQHLTVNDFQKVKYLNVERRMECLSPNTMSNVSRRTAPSYCCALNFKKAKKKTLQVCSPLRLGKVYVTM